MINLKKWQRMGSVSRFDSYQPEMLTEIREIAPPEPCQLEELSENPVKQTTQASQFDLRFTEVVCAKSELIAKRLVSVQKLNLSRLATQPYSFIQF